VIVLIYQRVDVVVGAIHSGQSIAPSAWVVHVEVAPEGEFVTDGENVRVRWRNEVVACAVCLVPVFGPA
jgi:hypothetical protein